MTCQANHITRVRTYIALALGLAACGDNRADCGYTTMMTYLRNIWPGQLVADDANVYYGDYDNDGAGTKLIIRHPTDTPDEFAIAVRPLTDSLGFGMAVDDSLIYWTAENDVDAYALFATPREGGPTNEVAAFSTCVTHGVAVDGPILYVGAVRCNGMPAQLYRVAADRTVTVLFSSDVADIEDIAATSSGVFVATTGGLLLVTPTSTDLLDGHPTHRLQVHGDELVYSTDEGVWGRALAGGTPRRLYEFTSTLENIRAFAVDQGGLYVSEPPTILFVPAASTQPVELVRDAGIGVQYIVARGGYAYWSALVWPGFAAVPDAFSGGVARVSPPCQ